MKDSKKQSVWIYAAILFTSAFIVIILAAYSQVKLNKNFNGYKGMEFSKQEENKNDFQLSLNAAQSENINLKKELDTLNNELEKAKNENDALNKKNAQLENDRKKSVESYEAVLSAEREFNSGNIVESAVILNKECEKSFLGREALAKYNALVEKTYNKAALILYRTGYEDYKKALYDAAIEKFIQSLALEPNDYFSDDCWFFKAYSEYKKGDKESAVISLNSLFQNYPDSNYAGEASVLLKKLQG
ncbi:MAG: hypothetical protein QHH06_11390 [Clostridiales bacterium]|nr:hypothetical protein [Eubacteriales bacterium]MDH7567068.1 hypothetical protein [Clostridiales bacterium]